MNKPQPKAIVAYDFFDCVEYLEKRYSCFKEGDIHLFWSNFVLKHMEDQIVTNGCYLHLDIEDCLDFYEIDDSRDKLFLEYMKEEFGNEIKFWVEW